jgi:hypothetical protein
MRTPACEYLEDYLDHDLAGVELSRFVDHLPECSTCRLAIADHERLENLIIDAARLEPIPAGLVARIETRTRLARRLSWAGITAAAAASVAVIWLIGHYLPFAKQPEPAVAIGPPEPSPSETLPAADHIRVTFPAGSNVLIVREKSEIPNVTFIQIYSGLYRGHALVKGPSSSLSERSH